MGESRSCRTPRRGRPAGTAARLGLLLVCLDRIEVARLPISADSSAKSDGLEQQVLIFARCNAGRDRARNYDTNKFSALNQARAEGGQEKHSRPLVLFV